MLNWRPKYYKNKIFTEKEREKMWINNLNRGLLWIYGERVKADDWETIDNLREYWQKYGREVELLTKPLRIFTSTILPVENNNLMFHQLLYLQILQ